MTSESEVKAIVQSPGSEATSEGDGYASSTSESSEAAASMNIAKALTPQDKCRYKTGKCSNVRSSKRNGERHQLCLYHRDKANRIQRKFDRQKRRLARLRKNSGSSSVSTSTMLPPMMMTSTSSFHDPNTPMVLLAPPEMCMADPSAPWSMGLAPVQIPMHSQCVAQTSPECGVAFHTVSFPSPVVVCGTVDNRALSHDELDFLCSAVLE